MQRSPPSSFLPKNSEAQRCGQRCSMTPARPSVSRKAISCSPRSMSRIGSPSAFNSDERQARVQYSRIRLPMGVPGPTRVSISLLAAVSMVSSRFVRSPDVRTIVAKARKTGNRRPIRGWYAYAKGRLDAARFARRPQAGQLARGIGIGREVGLAARIVEMGERPYHRREGELLPRNVGPLDQRHFLALRAGSDVGAEQARAVHDLHLADACHAVHGEQALDLDVGAGFLARLAGGGLLGGLAQLHVARGQGPGSLARLDGPLGQQDLVVPGAHRTGDDLGILVMDELAARAHQPLAVVAVGHPLLEVIRRIPRQARPFGKRGRRAHPWKSYAALMRAATPGRVLPSIHSRKAPPAVET